MFSLKFLLIRYSYFYVKMIDSLFSVYRCIGNSSAILRRNTKIKPIYYLIQRLIYVQRLFQQKIFNQSVLHACFFKVALLDEVFPFRRISVSDDGYWCFRTRPNLYRTTHLCECYIWILLYGSPSEGSTIYSWSENKLNNGRYRVE